MKIRYNNINNIQEFVCREMLSKKYYFGEAYRTKSTSIIFHIWIALAIASHLHLKTSGVFMTAIVAFFDHNDFSAYCCGKILNNFINKKYVRYIRLNWRQFK